MNPFDPAIFAAENPCVCCGTPSECACALLIPPADDFVTSPYADYATAAAAIVAQVANCIGFVRKQTGGTITAFTADDSVADELTLSVTGNPDNAPSCQAFMWASLNMKAGSTLTVVSTAGGGLAPGSGGGFLYDCAGVLVDELHGASVGFSIPADGTYIFLATITSLTSGFPFGSDTMTSVAASDDTMTVNPVIALWDDSGTTRKLWACPKLLLPPLTESTGDWYVDCAAALADITDHSTACAVYVTPNADSVGASIITFPPPPSFAFTASASNTATGSAPPIPTMNAWVSVNLTSGDTMNVAWDYSSYISVLSAWVVTVSLYDDDGVIIGTPQTDSSNTSGSFNFSAPYTGRFTVRFEVTGETTGPGPGGDFTSFSISDFDITCSGSFTANPIQARYDLGLDCAGLLDCGDTCP